ncbi:protein FAM186A isoform X2 [Castor canadensis]|uniref:Protein FAM186A isoform X2 n=1 Tax=Castor canadensis TaxID=51338 RepID=A0AC58NCR4_CASCN
MYYRLSGVGADDQEETSSDSDSENETQETIISKKWKRTSRNILDIPVVPELKTPLAVQAVLSKIEQAQLLRVKEEISMQLNDIMNNVQHIIARYNIDFNLPFGRRSFLIESRNKQRNAFLEKIIAYSKIIDIREKTLAHILAWLEEWNATLSEITEIDFEEYHHWVAQMEFLPETLKAIDNDVKILCRISMTLLEEQKRQKKKLLVRGTLWKPWKERVIKRPATAHALRPDQMISDQFATNTKVSEIQDMLQELIGTAMFTKLENNAIKYISSTMINLSKALTLVNDELKLINFQISNMYTDETEPEKQLSLRIIKEFSEENVMLQQKLKDAEEKCEQLIRFKIVTPLPITSALKVLPTISPESSMTKAVDKESSMDTILAKEFGNVIDESQRKGVTGTVKKWDSAMSYTAQMPPESTEQQYLLSEKTKKKPPEDTTKENIAPKKDGVYQKDGTGLYRSQKRKRTKGPQPQDTSESKAEQNVVESKSSYFFDPQTVDKKRKEVQSKSSTEPKSQQISSAKTKSEDVKSETNVLEESLRKLKSEHLVGKAQLSSEIKGEPSMESTDKESRKNISRLAEKQPDFTSEPQKVEKKGKKQVSKEGATEEKEMLAFTKQILSSQPGKSHSKVTKQTVGSADGKSEQSNLEAFHHAILTFLKEKTDNIGMPFESKSVIKEELLKRTEVEKLEVIKEKIEEYFQKVAETVTKTVRKYKNIKKKGQVGEKPVIWQKEPVPGSHFQKSEISSFLTDESTDPVISHLVQMLWDEIESERATLSRQVSVRKKEHSKEKKRQEEYLKDQEKVADLSGKSVQHEMLEEKKLSKDNLLRKKSLKEKKTLLQMKEEKQDQQQEQEQWQEEDVWKKQKKQRIQKLMEQDEKEKHGQEKPMQQQLEEGNQMVKGQGVTLKEGETRQAQKDKRYQKLKTEIEEEEEEKLRRAIVGGDKKRISQKKQERMRNEDKPKDETQGFTQSQVTLSPRPMKHLQVIPPLQGTKIKSDVKTSEILSAEKYTIPGTPSTSMQPSPFGPLPISAQPVTKFTTLTPEQAQGQGVTITPQQAQAQGITLTPKQAQDRGLILTPQQVQAQGITLTPQQAQDLGIILIPQQARVQGITLTLKQAKDLGITLTPQQAQDLGITLTPQQVQAQGITLTPQQVQAQGITLTSQQAQDLGISLTPQQAQSWGITLTPQQAQDLGIVLTPQQAQDLGITLIHQQAYAQGLTLTPQQAQDLGIIVTPQQAQAEWITLTPQQAQDLGIIVTPQQAQDLGIVLTPKKAQDLGITLTPQQVQDLGITLTPQQVQAQGITLTPQQAQDLGITLTPQQAQDLEITLTPQQAQDLGITLTLQDAQDLGLTPTLQQSQDLALTLTPQQVKALGITLTTQQAHDLGITLTSQKAQNLRLTVTPQQVKALGITLSPQQAQDLGLSLTSQQAQDLVITLTPQQVKALGITLTPQQVKALGLTLTSQQAQAQDITLPLGKHHVSGVTMSHEQAQGLRTTLTPEQVQTLKVPITPEYTETLKTSVTSEQNQAMPVPLETEQAQLFGVPLSHSQGVTIMPGQTETFGATLTSEQVQALQGHPDPKQAQSLMFTLTPEQARTLGITLTREQDQAAAITLNPEQAQALEVPLTEEQVWKLGASITPEKAQKAPSIILKQLQALGVTFSHQQAQAFHTPLTLEEPATLAPSTLRPFEELKTSLPTGPSIISKLSPSLRQPLTSSSIAEKSSIFKVTSTPLQKPRPFFTQVPFAPGGHLRKNILSDSGKLLAPQIFPTSTQIPLYKGGATPSQSLPPEVSSHLGQLPISGAPAIPGQSLSSSQFFISRSSLTPQPLPISEASLNPRLPLISRVPLTSGQIPRHLASLSPEQPLVPGASSIPREHLESGLSAISEQPQAFQPPATSEQSSFLQTPSTPGQHLAPWTLPGQASPSWISPTTGHSSTLWTLPIHEKPKKAFPSSVTQKRLETISSLKTKSSLIQPSVPDFKVPQVPFTTKKVQISEEETPMFPETFVMEPFQSYLTNYRTPESQTPYIDEATLSTLGKPITSLASLSTQLPKTSQILPFEWDQKSQLPPIDKSWILTSVLGAKKTKMMVPPSSLQDLEENRYFVDVEAQRKNLILLKQATKTSGLPSQQYAIACNLIIETLHMDTVRLGYLFRKYIAYRLIQRARNNIIQRLKAIQNTGKGSETQDLCTTLSRIDDYQKKVMKVWTEKQKLLQQKRNQCLTKMINLFNQTTRSDGVHLEC